MDYEALEKNICETLNEEQLKLGYCSEAVRLYYPLQTLNNYAPIKLTVQEMSESLERFSDYVRDRLGEVCISNKDERFCLALPPKASDYVHDNYPSKGFLKDLIDVIASHCSDIGIIKDVFFRYSEGIHCEEIFEGEFDYVIYFEDGCVDDYIYCFKNEGCHISYHRFSRRDFDLLGNS